MIGRGSGYILLLIPAKVRIPVAIVCFTIAAALMGTAMLSGAEGAIGWAFLMSLPLIVVGGLMLIPTIVGLCGEALAGMVVPNRKFNRAQVMYGPIEALRLENAFEEAMDELEDVVAAYPDELKAYTLMMGIACTDLNDPARVDEIYGRACEHIRRGEDRERLDNAYSFYAD